MRHPRVFNGNLLFGRNKTLDSGLIGHFGVCVCVCGDGGGGGGGAGFQVSGLVENRAAILLTDHNHNSLQGD